MSPGVFILGGGGRGGRGGNGAGDTELVDDPSSATSIEHLYDAGLNRTRMSVRGAFSVCGAKPLKASISALNEVAERLEPWRAPGFELRARPSRQLLPREGTGHRARQDE
jgi:hypothetical protein